MSFPFVKGHGTHNDFVVLPDLSGKIHGDLDPEVVARVCDRHAGIGADGVLRVMRGGADAEWFMDYRNADGSKAEMCGNGIRVFARYLAATRLVDPAEPLLVDTRAGVRSVTFCDDDEISVVMGVPVVGANVKVTVEGRSYDAVRVDIGNPHAVVGVDSLDEVGSLLEAPTLSAEDFPDGANVEFLCRRHTGEIAMRVHERGVGETLSCGTGACAAVVASVVADEEPTPAGRGTGADEADGGGQGTRPSRPVVRVVDVPGGTLEVTWDADDRLHLKGPAVLVAEGVWVG